MEFQILGYSIPAQWIKARNGLLLTASYFFYMNWEPLYALLLMGSTVVTWSAALLMEHYGRQRKSWLAASVVLNISVLLLFKYYNFLTDTIADAMQTMGIAVNMPSFLLLLPVGISFYIFQAVGYTIDVYRGTVRAERSLLVYALFVSFFPQLVAGPIERSSHLLPQFRERHTASHSKVMAGLQLMVWGYFMKLVVADRCALYVDAVFNNLPMHGNGSYALASLLFYFQIYGDFAGYSLIAIGASRMIGFRLADNFHRPYLVCSVSEFWHRWHISLSTWFRDYVYISLGGNRRGRNRQYANLLVTFATSGLWHGANWTFVCWGVFHGVLLCAEKLFDLDRCHSKGLSRLIRRSLTFLLVTMGWVLFRASTLQDALTVYGSVFSRWTLPELSFAMFTEVTTALAAIALLCAGEATARRVQTTGRASCPYLLAARKPAIIALCAVILLFGVLDGSQFIYFQF